MRLALLACLALALAACVAPTAPSAWKPAEPRYVAPKSGFELVPPPGWMRLGRGTGESFVATHDGLPLQRIAVGSTELGKPLGEKAKRVVTAGMTPDEVAEVVTDYLRAAEDLTEVAVVENGPATVAGRDGFRLVAAFRDAAGLRRRAVFYGVVEAGRFYQLMYTGAERVYFARDLDTFEEVARSFRLRPPQPAPAPAPAAPASPATKPAH